MKTHQRAMALTIALVFLATVLVSGGAVLWQIIQDNSNDNENSSGNGSSSESELSVEDQGDTLQGTQLEDYSPREDVSNLEVVDIKEGDGQVVEEGATVTAHYTGALAKNGEIFESSKDGGEPVEFGLDQVIQGWTEGVPGMKVGGVRRLIIPSEMAYGESGSPPAIGPNEPLVFDIELTAVTNP